MQDRSSRDTGQTLSDSMTSETSASTICPASMSSAEDSRAKISALLVRAQVSLVRARGFGLSTRASYVNSNHPTSSSKTSQLCAPAVLMSSPQKYPRSGTTCGGTVYQLPPSAPLTGGTDYSSSRGRQWPTPRVAEVNQPPSQLIPHVNHFRRPSGAKAQIGLEVAVSMWPTPCSSDTPRSEHSSMNRTQSKHQLDLPTLCPGPLNPDWVETLMGFPIGWTKVGQAAPISTKNLGNRQGLRHLRDLPKRIVCAPLKSEPTV